MKVAYIILCHKGEKQVNHLIDELLKDGSDCFVHIDKKSNLKILAPSERVTILQGEKRCKVRWATASVIHATLNLIESVLSSGKHYDYECLLSGQDFPIKKAKNRLDYLEKHKGDNFIEVIPHNTEIFKRFKKRNDLYYPTWMYSQTLIVRIARRLYSCLTGGRFYTFQIYKRKNFSGIDFEFGSQWWCLGYKCIEWIYSYVDSFVDVSYFNHAMTADECFFQSVFMMSPYRFSCKNKLTYVDWCSHKNHPRTFQVHEFKSLMNLQDYLFARKFDFSEGLSGLLF